MLRSLEKNIRKSETTVIPSFAFPIVQGIFLSDKPSIKGSYYRVVSKVIRETWVLVYF